MTGNRRLHSVPSEKSERLRVMMDAGPAVHQGAGLARYTERLAFHLRRDHGDEIDLHLYYNAHSGHRLPDTLQTMPQKSLRMGQYAWRLSVLASQLLHLPVYERLLPSGAVYHATEHLLPRLVRPTVLTVHDLIFERYPEHHTLSNRLFLKLGMPLFVRVADAIIAVSQQTRRDLVDLYNVPEEKISVIYEGIDERFRPAGERAIRRVREAYGIRQPYLLMVGTLEPRKNHAASLRALARLKQKGLPHCLVITGGRGWMFEPIRQLVQDLGLQSDVIFTGRVPDEDLPPLYTGTDCFLMPSLYEGFGFPVLEARACGAPVVCSDVSSLPELAGDGVVLVDVGDETALDEAVRSVLDSDGGAEAGPGRRGRRSVGFDWKRCASSTAAVYRRVAGPESR